MRNSYESLPILRNFFRTLQFIKNQFGKFLANPFWMCPILTNTDHPSPEHKDAASDGAASSDDQTKAAAASSDKTKTYSQNKVKSAKFARKPEPENAEYQLDEMSETSKRMLANHYKYTNKIWTLGSQNFSGHRITTNALQSIRMACDCLHICCEYDFLANFRSMFLIFPTPAE